MSSARTMRLPWLPIAVTALTFVPFVDWTLAEPRCAMLIPRSTGRVSSPRVAEATLPRGEPE